jgi:hypothetical protein
MDGWILIGLGVLFVALGIGVFIWGRKELAAYYEGITRRTDVREFLERSPLRPEPEALKIGGIIIGVVGVAFFLLGIFLY